MIFVPSPTELVVTALAAARLTRLVTTDSISDRLRFWAAHRDFTDELFSCPWCIGFWISLATVTGAVTIGHHPPVSVLLVALAVSQAVGMIATLVDAAD